MDNHPMSQDEPAAPFTLADAGKAGLILLIILVLAIPVGSLPLSPIMASLTMGFFVQAGLAGGVAAIMAGRRLPWRETFGFNRERLQKAILYGLVGCLVIVPLMLVIGGAWNKLLTAIGVTIKDQLVIQWLLERKDPLFRCIFVVQAVVVAPVCEELFFRGLLERSLGRRFEPLDGAFITALLFALFHAHLPSLLPLFAMSLGLSWVYRATRSLTAAIVMHAAYNLMNVAWVLLVPPDR